MLTLRAMFWLVASAAAIRAVGYRRAATRLLRAPGTTRLDDLRARQLTRAVHRASRILRPRPACLSRALAGARLLAAESLAARVTIGVTPAAGRRSDFAAHAWLTHGALMLAGGRTDRDYLPLCAIDACPRPGITAVS